MSMRLYRPLLAIAAVIEFHSFAGAATPAKRTVEYVRTVPSVEEFTKPHNVLVKFLNWVAGEPDRTALVRPYAVAQDSVGRLLIADPGEQGVHIYDFEKRKYTFLRGPKKDQMQSPMDLVCDAADNIYVSDSVRRKIFVFDAKGKFLRTIGGGAGATQFQRPTGMALDKAARRLYVSDTLRHQILVFGLDGTLIRTIGHRGTGPGEFNFPTSLALAAGRVYVVDAMNFRIQSFTQDGQFERSFGQAGDQSGTFNRPKGIAADTDGNLYVADALFETVQVFDTDGRLLYYFGSSGTKAGQFQFPTGILIDNRNVIYVADSMNRRIQVFRSRSQSE